MAIGAVWKNAAAGWLRKLPLWRAGPRDAQPFTVGNRRIYVMPTRFGLFIGLSLAVLNLGSLNYNNNAALLLGFLTISLCNNALIAGHLSLLGLTLRTRAPAPVFAGQPLALTVSVQARKADALDFWLEFRGSRTAFTIGPGDAAVTLPIPTLRRGRFGIDRIRLCTLQPLGLARAWSTLHLNERALVYPAPLGQPLQAHYRAAGTGSGRNSRLLGEQPHHLREYRSGDSRRQIAWKASARAGNLQVREYERADADALVLDWDALGHLGHEARISQLCLWALQAEQKQLRFAMKLPGRLLASGSGAEHLRHCLEALALMPDG